MMRRSLILTNLNDVIEECERLQKHGYTKTGNWSLGQICHHLRLTIQKNIAGYPLWMTILGFPLRPFLRSFALPNLLAGKSPKGIPTAGMFIPPDNIDDSQEVDLFKKCIQDFLSNEQKLHSHPGFGAMSKEKFEKFHAAHSAHHLSFLIPKNTT